MKKGPQSAEARSVATLAQQISDVQRIEFPDPPYELSEAEGHRWNAIVRDCPSDWFAPKNLALLTQYVRHLTRADRIAHMIQLYEDDLDRANRGQATLGTLQMVDYFTMLRAQQSETRQIAMLATKMRIAQQSTIEPVQRKSIGKRKLWELPQS